MLPTVTEPVKQALPLLNAPAALMLLAIKKKSVVVSKSGKSMKKADKPTTEIAKIDLMGKDNDNNNND